MSFPVYVARCRQAIWRVSFGPARDCLQDRSMRRTGHLGMAAARIVALLGAIFLAVPGYADNPPPVARLLELTAKRLAIGAEVAQAKWNSKAAIEDIPREQRVIDGAVTQAGVAGEGLAREYFAAQIEASKAVQWKLHREWTRAHPPAFANPADLAGDIRPRLDTLMPRLIAALGEAEPWLAKAEAEEILRARPPGADPLAWKIAVAPLTARAQARPGESRLEVVRRSGLLRICMTGDYAPYTIWRRDVFEFDGADAQLGRQLAASLKVDAQFVATTWAGMMRDFQANRCDLVSGGVTVTPERAQLASFSIPLLTDGKTPIARCADLDRFQTLAQIDRPGVRVIVNPGGTNERFARDHLKQATLTVFPDNTTLFDEILNHRADVMITDGIEARLQQKRRPGLCAVHPDKPFTVYEKAYLLPMADGLFKEYIDRFLGAELANGGYGKYLDGWLR